MSAEPRPAPVVGKLTQQIFPCAGAWVRLHIPDGDDTCVTFDPFGAKVKVKHAFLRHCRLQSHHAGFSLAVTKPAEMRDEAWKQRVGAGLCCCRDFYTAVRWFLRQVHTAPDNACYVKPPHWMTLNSIHSDDIAVLPDGR